jgi:parallel beta-helix repeat protein
MTIASTINRNDYTGNGSTATYSYTFKIFQEDDLRVIVKNTFTTVETVLVKGTDYTVSGVGDTNGGAITLIDDGQEWIDANGFLKGNMELTLRRIIQKTQETDIRNQGDFYPEAHEDVFDKLVMIDQEQQGDLDRSVKLTETTSPDDFSPLLPTNIAGAKDCFLVTNKDGNGFRVGPKVAEGTGGGGSGLRDNVLNYGADNTGATVTNAAFLEAVERNGSVYVPEGIYVIGDLEIDSKKIYGIGELRRAAGAEHVLILKGDNPIVEGLTFNSSGTTVNGDSEIKLDDGCKNAQIESCTFKGSLYAAINADDNGTTDDDLTYAEQVDGFLFANNNVPGSYSRHIYLHNVKNIRIVNNEFKNSTRDSIRLRQKVEKAIIANNVFQDIGEEYPEITERPANWLSTEVYSLDDEVSVPPYGIYKCIKETGTTTMGDNPATAGADDWTNIAPGYFETKDAVDAYWSGKELVIANNIINKTASHGLDIKGTNPGGEYSSGRCQIANNIIMNCFGIGINIHSSALDENDNFHYVSDFIITGNQLYFNNRERIDIAQSAIVLRHGVRNCTISNNIIKNNYARGITVANLSETALINQDIIISKNHVTSNGIPGHLSNVGLNIGPTDGLVVEGNVVKNLDPVEEYKLVVAGSSTANQTLVIPTANNVADIDVSISDGDDQAAIAAAIYNRMKHSDFDVPFETIEGVSYYGNIRLEEGDKATDTDTSGQIKCISQETGASGNGKTITITEGASNPLLPTDWALDDDNNLSVSIRTTTKPEHFLQGFISAASLEIKALYNFELTTGTPSDAASQSDIGAETLTLAGGTNSNTIYFNARYKEQVNLGMIQSQNSTFDVTISRQNKFTNSVQTIGMSLRDREPVGSTVFEASKMSNIIRDNICTGNADLPRFNIQWNYHEPRALVAYIDSDNTGNTNIIQPAARQMFANGADSDASNHLNTQAYLIEQGIILKARLAGLGGNNISLTIEQPTDPDQILRVISAPALYGGREIILRLPTDEVGDPVDVTIEEAEIKLKSRLGQGLLAYENNYIGLDYRPQPEVNQGPKGDKGDQGDQGIQGIQGIQGPQGTVLHPKDGIELIENFISTTAVGNNGWTLYANSGSVGANVTSGDSTHFGIMRLDTSSSASSAPTLSLGGGLALVLGGATITIEFEFKIQVLSTVSEEFEARLGLLDNTTGTIGNDAVFFKYDRLTSTNWIIVSRAGGTETATTTSTAVAAGSWLRGRIEINAAASSVEYFIDDVSIGTITTNIPSGTSQVTSPAFQMVKSAGTTSRNLYLDWVYFKAAY